jgi:glucose-1-phosphate cytidylyltransferase
MQLVILAGGKGSRISEETTFRPKPLVEIGNMPIIWHIMKYYSCFGVKDFIICCGYKGYLLKEFFANYLLHSSDVSINTSNQKIIILKKQTENWNIKLIDTGEESNTAGRILKIQDHVRDNFFLTYGDGLSNVNINELNNLHKKNNKIGTLTAVQPSGRFGSLKISNKSNLVENFIEKPDGDGGWINGGFFVFNKKIFKFIKNDQSVLETDVLPLISEKKQISAYKHRKFWYAMDTLRDKIYLQDLWDSNKAPWKIWK